MTSPDILPLSQQPGFVACADPSTLTDEQLAALCDADGLRKLARLLLAAEKCNETAEAAQEAAEISG